jgi:hypothetical protein
MADSMETGGVGKNPAIDKINRLDAVSGRISAVSELENKVFHTKRQRAEKILQRRKQIIEEFGICFKRREEEHENILHKRERGVYAGEHPAGLGEAGRDFAAGTAGRISGDGR